MKKGSNIKNSKSNIVSFKKYKKKDKEIVSSTIAAILAVKIDHPKDMAPEDFLINQIENYDNIEILAFEDALDNETIGLTSKDAQNEASNDA